jgi:ribosome-associated toxin RatA of RatAB toxin-antitoxin module
MHSEIAIRIAAPADLVFSLARDVERWSDLLPHYTRSVAVERRPDGSLVADFIARRPLIGVLGLGLPVTWRSRTWSDPATRHLRFVHLAGATKGMDVTWHIDPAADVEIAAAGRAGCTVTIAHDFAPRVPGFARFVDRVFTRPIAGRTLATFKALAEALQSDATQPANPRG